jgi:predicted phage terminase large subunit-like protein
MGEARFNIGGDRTFHLEAARRLLSIMEAEDSLYAFLKQAWPIGEGTTPFVEGWALQAICEHLEAVSNRQIRNLLINIPPRCTKSTLISIMWPAWRWIKEPAERFVFASFASNLSRTHSRKCREIIESPWYQRNWGHIYQLAKDQNAKGRFDNNKAGFRIAAGIHSQVTGDGGSVLVCDDPNNAQDGESEAKRLRAIEFWDGTWASRLNDRKKDVRVVVQQRIHEADISGHIMNNDVNGEWVKLILPMEFEEKRRSITVILPSTNGKPWSDPRKKEGELLWPERMGATEVEKLKADLRTEYRIAGQLQQRPAPAEGGIIKKSWWGWWKKEQPPTLHHIIQSWDTALEAKDENADSACTTWGIFYDDHRVANLILLSLWRGKVEYPDLRRVAKRLYEDYRDDGSVMGFKADGKHQPDMVLIEAKASGHSLIQDLHRAGIPVIRFNPGKYGDKIERVRAVTHLIEAGRVWLPASPPDYTKLRRFADLFCEKAAIFPNGDSRDLVDTMTQVLLRLNASGWLTHPDDDDIRDTNVKIKHSFY